MRHYIALLSLALVGLSACTPQLVRVKDLTAPGPATVMETTTVTRDSGGVKVTQTTTVASNKSKLAAQLELGNNLAAYYKASAENACNCMLGMNGYSGAGRSADWYAQQGATEASYRRRMLSIDSTNAVNEMRNRTRPPQ